MSGIVQTVQAVAHLPFGPVGIVADRDAVLAVHFMAPPYRLQQTDGVPLAQEAAQQLQAYVNAPAFEFDLPLKPAGTAFQHKVWQFLQQIQPGQLRYYGDVAQQLGSSARAVGQACRRNPVPFIIPCHRIISRHGTGGFSGQQTGYAMTVKHWLLTHEQSRMD